jgi:hypothetical protein
MAFNPFIGWSEAELLTAKRSVQEEIMGGGQIISGGSGGTSFSKAPQFSALTRYNLILKSLNAINPTTYPLADMMPTSQKPTFYADSQRLYPNT